MAKHPCYSGPDRQPCGKESCRLCWLYKHDERYRSQLDPGAPPGVWQQAIGFATAVVRHAANGFAGTPDAELGRRRAVCQSCEHRQGDRCGQCGCVVALKSAWESERCPLGRWSTAAPSFLRAFDETTLVPHVPGKRFNPSLIRWQDGYLLAFRNGWCGSEIYLATLDANFNPTGWCKQLALANPHWANYGREDPRLFMFRGQLHIAYIGVVGPNDILHTSQLYARLSDTLDVERIYAPQYHARNYWEKNWQFFEHGGELYASYSISPHRVLHIDGNNAELVYNTPTPAPWTGGELRGGASPVLVGDEWWCFFHSRVESVGHRIYNTGVFCFANKPPFRMTRIIPEPILVADPASKPGDQYASVVFSGGAVLDGDRWVVAHGLHDRWAELHTFSHADLVARMVQIHPPAWWAWREGTEDQATFAAIWAQDEYQLGKVDLTGKTVLDIGAHMGSFAFSAWKRGCRNVHCYEPDPDNFELLRQNASNMPGVTAHHAAVGRSPGTLYYQPSAHHPAYSAHGRCSLDAKGLPVPTVSLDDAIDAAGGAVDLLKLDAEGAEFPALYGCTKLDKVAAIVGEYHGFAATMPLEHAPGDPPHHIDHLATFLRDKGFVVQIKAIDGNGFLWAHRGASA